MVSLSQILPSLGLLLQTDVYSPLLPTICPPYCRTSCPLLGTNLRLELKHDWEWWMFFFVDSRGKLMRHLHCVFIEGLFIVELSLWCTSENMWVDLTAARNVLPNGDSHALGLTATLTQPYEVMHGCLSSFKNVLWITHYEWLEFFVKKKKSILIFCKIRCS